MPSRDKAAFNGRFLSMARMGGSASTPMYLDDRLAGGYVIVCSGDGGEHSFLSHRLGPSVECPRCGCTALSANLLDAYYARAKRLVGIGSRQAPWAPEKSTHYKFQRQWPGWPPWYRRWIGLGQQGRTSAPEFVHRQKKPRR